MPMSKINGMTIFHGTKPGVTPAENKYIKKNKNITTKRLISSYLCSGKDSRCVTQRKCECLDACLYGQLYIKKTSEDQK